MRSALRVIKNAVLPRSVGPRRIRFGLARGATSIIDFRYDTAFFFGTYERELGQHFRRLVRSGTKCYDVGGHRAWDAISLAMLSGEKVVSFECNPDNVVFMEKAIACSGLKVEVLTKYVADVDDPYSITLDRAATETFVPDFVKIDIEGAEGAALRGARRLLEERGPAMIIEVHSEEVEKECLEILGTAGYQVQIVGQSHRMGQEARGLTHNRWIVCESKKK